MSGKRITIRRGRVEAPTVAEEPSALAKAEQAKPTGVPGWNALVDSLISEETARSMLLSPELMGGSSTRSTLNLDPTRSPTRESTVLPEGGVTMNFAGVDLAVPGADGTVVSIVGPNAIGVRDTPDASFLSEQIAQEVVRRVTTDVDRILGDGDRARNSMRERGAPVVEVDYRYETMTTVILLSVWLNGPSQPPAQAYCNVLDGEVRDAHLNHSSEYDAASYLHDLIVARLGDALAAEVSRTVGRALDAAMRSTVGVRTSMNRIFSRRGPRG